jgi:hypothetical protein
MKIKRLVLPVGCFWTEINSYSHMLFGIYNNNEKPADY